MEGRSAMDGEEEEQDDDFLSFSSYANDSDERSRASGGGEGELQSLAAPCIPWGGFHTNLHKNNYPHIIINPCQKESPYNA